MKVRILLLSLLTILTFSLAGKPVQAPKNHIVEIKDMKFQPEVLTVNKGDIVTWINRDYVPHDVTEINKAWASPRLKTNQSWKKVITKSASYYCSIHVVMKGKLIVK